MTKPTKEEIAALERWHSALVDAERGLELARPSSVRYEVLDLGPWADLRDPEGLMTTIRTLRRQIDRFLDRSRGAGR